MPTVWRLCNDCMDLKSGDFIHWPLPGSWLKNADLLALMRFAWSAWRVLSIPAETAVNGDDLLFQQALIEGKPALPQKLFGFAAWEATQTE